MKSKHVKNFWIEIGERKKSKNGYWKKKKNVPSCWLIFHSYYKLVKLSFYLFPECKKCLQYYQLFMCIGKISPKYWVNSIIHVYYFVIRFGNWFGHTFFEKLATLAMYLVYFRLCYYMSWIVPCLIDLTLIMVQSKYLPWQFYTVITTKTLCYYWISVQVVPKDYLSDHLDLRRNKIARYLLQSLRMMIIKYVPL